jgi:hypothetical protein
LEVRFHETRVASRTVGAANFALLRKRHPRKDRRARKRKTTALAPEFLAETLAGATDLEKG